MHWHVRVAPWEPEEEEQRQWACELECGKPSASSSEWSASRHALLVPFSSLLLRQQGLRVEAACEGLWQWSGLSTGVLLVDGEHGHWRMGAVCGARARATESYALSHLSPA
jgi:hypothetical protein